MLKYKNREMSQNAKVICKREKRKKIAFNLLLICLLILRIREVFWNHFQTFFNVEFGEIFRRHSKTTYKVTGVLILDFLPFAQGQLVKRS